jgi:DNA-binding winged helix-turn-helix (wHTH) protein/TolB-like protein/Tfp pilus assembly protein PilF
MGSRVRATYEFGPFRVDPVERVLWRANEPVPLTSKVFDILLLLLENNGHVVEKERLMKTIWPNTLVEEGNLTQNISLLRKALDAGAQGHQYIQTVPRRGYRFAGHVHELFAEGDELIIEERSRSRVVIEEDQSDVPETGRASAITMPSTPPRPIGKTRDKWRFRRASVFVSVALVGIAIVGIAIIAIPLVTGYFRFSSKREGGNAITASNTPRSIAVLPFRSLTPNAGDEFLGLGMTDALISKLSNIKELKVRPTSAVRKYSGQERDAAAVGRELKVDSVLEGSVRKYADQIRISVQLIDVKESRTLWARAFDEKSTDILAVEDAISESVAQAMRLKLTEAEHERLGKNYTVDPAAHELYLRGRFYLNQFTEDGTKLARKHFEQAIARDSRYALAYSGLAESFAFGEIGLPPEEAFPKARDAATKAIELDESVGGAHAALAQVAFLWDWNWPAAEKQFKRAIELAPADPEIHHMYAHFLTAMGRFDEALTESQRLLELDPLSPASRNHLGWHYLYAHQFDQAIEQYKVVLAIDPNFAEAHRQLAEALWEKARFDESVVEMNRQFELIGRGDDVRALKEAYATGGWDGYWRKRLQLAQERSKRAFVSPSGIAYNYAALKDRSNTLTWLETAYREHDHGLVYLKVDHVWDGVRSEPRLGPRSLFLFTNRSPNPNG